MCAVGRMVKMPVADARVRQVLREEVLRPKVINRALDLVLAELARQQGADPSGRASLRQRLADVEQRLSNLAGTAARGGAVPVILEALTVTTGSASSFA